MAEKLDLKDESTTNPCCSQWRDRYLKLQHKCKKVEEGRAALKRAVDIYKEQFDNLQNECQKFHNAFEEQKVQTNHERMDKEKESSARISLENEISTLKSEILSLSKTEDSVPQHVDEELKCLRGRLIDSEKEINCLKEQLQKKIADVACESSKVEKTRVQVQQELTNLKSQLSNVEKEKKQLKKDLQKEKTRADSERNRADEMLKTAKTEHSDDLNQNLETEISRLKDLLDKEKKRVDSEIKKAETEKKNANKVKEMLKSEQNRADEFKKLVDHERKKAEDFASQLQKLKCESESSRIKDLNKKKVEAEKKKTIKEKKKAEEQQKIAEMSTKHALEQQQRADHLHQQLEEYRKKYDNLKKDVDQKKSQPKNGADLETVKESELKKVADMYKLQAITEKSRADKIAEKLENTKNRSKSLTDPMKSGEMKLIKKRLKLEKARVKHANQVMEHEKNCKKAVEEELNQLKLEFAHFSNRVGLCNCLAISNVSKSCIEKNGIANKKRKFLHPESGKEIVKITKSSDYFKPILNSCTPSIPISGTCTESTAGTPFKTGKKLDSFALVSSMSSFSDRQLAGPQEKSRLDNNTNLQLVIKAADNNVKGHVVKVKNKEGNNRKSGVNIVTNTRNNDLEIFKNIFDGDYMKLLNLDDEIEEEKYRLAVENLISPTLPSIQFEINQSDEIINNDKSGKTGPEFCAFSETDFVFKNVVSTVSAEENLSPKEKVRVFFSLFLKSFSSIALTNFDHIFDANFLNNLEVFSGQLKKAISDVETRTMFTETVNIDELIILLQSFIINKEILPFLDTKPSFHQLILVTILLATVCAAFDHIDVICDTSYTISGITSSSTSTILHVFAYICGEKILNNGLTMTVVKSLVLYHEKDNISSDFPPCATCPFSIGAISTEEVASILLKRFSDCFMHEYGVTTCKSIKVYDDNLSDLSDVLSLLELLASKMKWGWVCENIVSQVLKLLEVCVAEASLTAVFVLLGQIARLGIDANGFEDTEVENIRIKLSLFISEINMNKISLRVQFAAVNALVSTTPLDFKEICSDQPPLLSPSTATDSVQKWFSLLTDAQKSLSESLSVRLLTANVS